MKIKLASSPAISCIGYSAWFSEPPLEIYQKLFMPTTCLILTLFKSISATAYNQNTHPYPRKLTETTPTLTIGRKFNEHGAEPTSRRTKLRGARPRLIVIVSSSTKAIASKFLPTVMRGPALPGWIPHFRRSAPLAVSLQVVEYGMQGKCVHNAAFCEKRSGLDIERNTLLRAILY